VFMLTMCEGSHCFTVYPRSVSARSKLIVTVVAVAALVVIIDLLVSRDLETRCQPLIPNQRTSKRDMRSAETEHKIAEVQGALAQMR